MFDTKTLLPLGIALLAGIFAALGFAISINVEMLQDPVAWFWLVVDILVILAFLAAGIAMRTYASMLSTLAYVASACMLGFTAYAYSDGGPQVYLPYVDVVGPILLMVFAAKMLEHAHSG